MTTEEKITILETIKADTFRPDVGDGRLLSEEGEALLLSLVEPPSTLESTK